MPEQPVAPAKPRLQVFLALQPRLKGRERMPIEIAIALSNDQRRRIRELDDELSGAQRPEEGRFLARLRELRPKKT